MRVIVIKEDWHGTVGIAMDYVSAIDYLLEKEYITEGFQVYVSETDSYIPLKIILGPDWDEKIASWDIEKFNDFFEESFLLQTEEVYTKADI